MHILRGALAALSLALAVAPAGARTLAASRLYEHPTWAAVGGLGTYAPESSVESTSAELALGIRFIKPYEHDATYDFSSTQVTFARTFGDREHVTTPEISFSNYLPRTSLFRVDHHFFYGAGVGCAIIERDGQETLTRTVGSLSGGLNARLRAFDLEAAAKYSVSPQRRGYDASGVSAQVAVVYPLGD